MAVVTIGLVVTAGSLQVVNRDADWGGVSAAIVAFSSFAVVGFVVAYKRSQNPIGWLFLAIPFLQGVTWFSSEFALWNAFRTGFDSGTVEFFTWLSNWTWWPALALMPTFPMLLFPNGELLSRRWRWVGYLAAFAIIGGVLMFPFDPAPYRLIEGEPKVQNPFGIPALGDAVELSAAIFFPSILLAGGLSILSLIIRFRRSRGEERQQVKWIAFAGAVLAIGFIGSFFIPAIGENDFLFGVVVTMLPVTAGIAILRYRLYDIDLIINRALVYGALTALLVLAYVGIVFGLQAALSPFTAESDLAVAGSTLAVAALFRPFRARVQGFIDHRFYRRKFNAQRTIDDFTSHLRDEVDLGAVSGQLVDAVRQTMQPT
ncbi:MAG: hypothetical protein ACRDKT_16500, partial [Actinomycetota bacterium]